MTKADGTVKDELILRGKKIPVELRHIDQGDLHFYLENPRLYSIVRAGGDEPTEDEIEEKLLSMDHVRHLISAIEINGGLIDPVIVRGGDNVVLEGNSRLAAYRHLRKKDAIKWGKLKARVLPNDISEADVFALLGEYHIHGKKDWAPYEQAGYLYRRKSGQTIEALAADIGLKKGEVGHLIGVYQFMLDHSEKDVARWSYYDEYLKSNKIAKAREEYPELDKLIVKKVRSGDIPTAMDLRDGLKKICVAGGKTLSRFVDEKTTFEQALESAESRGAGDATVQKLRRFKDWVTEPDTEAELVELKGELRSKCKFELEKIRRQCDKLGKTLVNEAP